MAASDGTYGDSVLKDETLASLDALLLGSGLFGVADLSTCNDVSIREGPCLVG